MNITNQIECEEEWRTVPGYEEYEVSNLGRVRCLNFNKIKGNVRVLKQCKISKGYLKVSLRRKRMFVHRLVALAFLPIPKEIEIPEVNHIDENKENNRVENLEWLSRKDNNTYGTRTERAADSRTDWTPVLQYSKSGDFIREWRCARDAEKSLTNGINRGSVLICCKGQYKTAHGFIWRFKE